MNFNCYSDTKSGSCRAFFGRPKRVVDEGGEDARAGTVAGAGAGPLTEALRGLDGCC